MAQPTEVLKKYSDYPTSKRPNPFRANFEIAPYHADSLTMQIKIVPSKQGSQWVFEGFKLVRAQPLQLFALTFLYLICLFICINQVIG